MYHAHQVSRSAWAGQPKEDDNDEEFEGQEMTPHQCLELAYRRVMQDWHVLAGE